MMTALPQLQDARITLDGRVATLTLDRNDVRNELTGTRLVDDIEQACHWVNTNDAVSALVVTGAGKAFSAGGNVKHMLSREGSFGGNVSELDKKYRFGIQRIAIAMHQLEVPSVAAINGAAIGAGFDLACLCDMRIAAHDARLGETFINLGIIPGDGGAWLLQRIVGYQRAAELTFTGRVFGADEALAMGLVLSVVEPHELPAAARALAAQIAAQPPQALRLSKRLMKLAQRQELPDFLQLCAVYQGICHNTEDHLEAVSAFLDKRPPHFVGK